MDWQGGKKFGSYYQKQLKNGKTRYIARMMKDRKSHQKFFDSAEKADNWLLEKSKEFGLLKNMYRILENHIEVQLHGGKTFLCDKQDIDAVEAFVWYSKKDKKNVYVQGTVDGKTKVSFHRLIEPWGEGNNPWGQVDHINNNGLDNRRQNLRSGDDSVNQLNQRIRIDNTSGKTGVHYNEKQKLFVVQWKENGKRHKKRFSVCDNSGEAKDKHKGNNHKLTRTYEEAKHLAYMFRNTKDLELGYTNGKQLVFE
jgi:hypothetical protein